MDEFSFIQSIQPKFYRQSGVQRGIGDDAAVLAIGGHLVTSIDTFVEDIHFNEQTMDLFATGYRVLAANMSDMAAMGATPRFYLVSLVIPQDRFNSSLTSLFEGMDALARSYDMDLIGGDTVQGDTFTISITVLGTVDPERVRYRHHAQVGDVVFVTGSLGDARAGLELLLHRNFTLPNESYFIERHRYPTPRVLFAQSLRSIQRVCLNDISDGIASELIEIARASQVRLDINVDDLPIHPILQQELSREKQEAWALFGGEDFELVGTVCQKDWPAIQKKAQELDIEIQSIGQVHSKEQNEDFVYLTRGQKHISLDAGGYNHFR